MTKISLSLKEFESILGQCFSRETSADSKNWSPNNPSRGHCAVVALLVQNVFGGEIMRVSLVDTPFEDMGSHYWNRLPNGGEVDLTREQFGDWQPPYEKGEIQSRCRPFGYLEPAMRYCHLLGLFLEELSKRKN